MWSVAANRQTNTKMGKKADPAPTRFSYRYQRLMLTPLFRKFLHTGLPILVLLGVAGGWVAQEKNRALVADKFARMQSNFEQRPEFTVNALAVNGVDQALASEVREVLPVGFPVSQFELDLQAMRQKVIALAPVKDARLHIRDGIVQVDVIERQPVAVWRNGEGLHLIDEAGVLVASLERRADRADLPFLAGQGAAGQVTEALDLIHAAGPFADRLRGIVRRGERRWDVVLDEDLRIMLPAQDSVMALEQVIALAEAGDLLERDLQVVDMRVPSRPTLRLTPAAREHLRDQRISVTEEE